MMVRIAFSFFLLSVSTMSLQAQVKRKGVTPAQVVKPVPAAVYTIKQLNGKWQEVKRIPSNQKQEIAFSDTLLMTFTNGNAEVKDATSMRMTMKGSAEIEAPNSLTVAGDAYNILSLDENKLVVDDGEFIRELEKRKQFYYETVGKIKVERDSFSKPALIDIEKIKGKRDVYARKAEPGTINDQMAIIKSINVISIEGKDSASGTVLFYTGTVSEMLPCRIYVHDGTLQIITSKTTWNYFTYKADGTEFVFGEAGKLLYFTR